MNVFNVFNRGLLLLGVVCCCCSEIQVAISREETFRMRSKVTGEVQHQRCKVRSNFLSYLLKKVLWFKKKGLSHQSSFDLCLNLFQNRRFSSWTTSSTWIFSFFSSQLPPLHNLLLLPFQTLLAGFIEPSISSNSYGYFLSEEEKKANQIFWDNL